MLTQIINARILTPQGWLKDGSVLIRDNKYIPHSIFFNNTNDSCCSRNYRKINE